MNRILVRYYSANNTIGSRLEIYNDIKGWSCDQIGMSFYGKDADIMLEYFKNAVVKKNDKVMNYGVFVDGNCVACPNEDE